MALYDVVRWLEVFTPFLGMGTAEVNLRIGLKGLQFAQFLPPAMGEPTIFKQAIQEKIERTERRRQEAFAALERERLRRELTDDERERLRLEKIAEMIRERDMQERALLDAAYIALVECREKGPLALKSDIEPVLNLWRQLDVTMNDRHPRSLKSVIGHVNAAVVMLELEGDQEVKVVRQEAKRLTIQALEELTTFFTSSFPPSVEIIDDADFQGGFTGFVFEDGQALLLVYLFQSCMTLLQRLQDYESLSQNSSVVMIIGFLDEILTSDERISLQGEFIGKDLKVLAADDIKAEVDATLKDFQQIRELELRRRDLARQIRLAAELQAAADAHAETPEEKLQRLRAERDASRVLRKLERIRLINARIKLYGMIQSDQIKPLFRLHTKNRAAVNSFGEKDPDIEDPLL